MATEILHGFLGAGTGRTAIIAHLGAMVRSLAQSANWRAGINEGAVLEHLDRLLAETEKEGTTVATLASSFLDFAANIGSGFPKALRHGLEKRLGGDLDSQKAGSNQRPWLVALSAIYADPCHRGLAAAMEHLARSPPDGYRVRLRDHAATLCALGQTDDPRGHLQALSRLRRRRELPGQSISTVHKAKGLEFRRVLICPADKHQYPATPYGARLLYVALSRATHGITIITDTASPLSHLDFSGAQP